MSVCGDAVEWVSTGCGRQRSGEDQGECWGGQRQVQAGAVQGTLVQEIVHVQSQACFMVNGILIHILSVHGCGKYRLTTHSN